MPKNNNANMYCRHIISMLLLSVCTFIFNMIEYRMINANIKGYLLMFDLSAGLQIAGCAILGFRFGKKESVIPKSCFNRMDIARLLLIPICCAYMLERETSWKIADLALGGPGISLSEASIIQQFIVVKLIGIPTVIAFTVFEVFYLVAKHTGKAPDYQKRS